MLLITTDDSKVIETANNKSAGSGFHYTVPAVLHTNSICTVSCYITRAISFLKLLPVLLVIHVKYRVFQLLTTVSLKHFKLHYKTDSA